MRHLIPLLSVTAVVTAMAVAAPPPSLATVADNPPNVVVIVVDDQTRGTLDAMPNVRHELLNKGVNLTQGLIPTSLCCPSRSSLLTGNYAHRTGVYTNWKHQHGGWSTFVKNGNETSTLATHLQSAGYHTGLFGKYLNGYAESAPNPIPEGWDEFVFLIPDVVSEGAYYNYTLSGTIPDEHHGEAARDYSTDIFGQLARDFIANAPTDQPLFLYFAPLGPHFPMTPAPRDKGTWPLEPASAIPALGERNLSDKPTWVQSKHPVDPTRMRVELTKQHEALMSVDDAVGQIVTALGDRAQNTVFVYLSDNGLMLGGHNLIGKDVPYDFSTRVPMIIRWDGHIARGSTSDRLTLNIDLTATVAEATGLSWDMDGTSFLSTDRSGTVLEQMEDRSISEHPAYCGLRTQDYLFVRYNHGTDEEFYDHTSDPKELHNGIDLPENKAVIRTLRSQTKAACVPRPPGFAWRQ